MNKREKLKQKVEKHLVELQKLVDSCGGSHLKIKTINSRLRILEHRANEHACWACSGQTTFGTPYTMEDWEETAEDIYNQVQKLFNNNLKNFFLNADARGYTLKLREPHTWYYTDWGGYGILSPDLTED